MLSCIPWSWRSAAAVSCGPDAQVNLNFTGRGQDRRLHVVVARVDRRDALVDVGFAHSRDAKLARHEAHSCRKAREARFHLRGEHGFQFVRRAGKQNDDAAARFEPQAGRGAAIVFENGRAFGNHGLARIHFGHRAANLAEARFDLAHHGGIAREFSAEQIGHGVARAIVFGGAEASAGDDEFDALGRFVEGVAQAERDRRRPPSCA